MGTDGAVVGLSLPQRGRARPCHRDEHPESIARPTVDTPDHTICLRYTTLSVLAFSLPSC